MSAPAYERESARRLGDGVGQGHHGEPKEEKHGGVETTASYDEEAGLPLPQGEPEARGEQERQPDHERAGAPVAKGRSSQPAGDHHEHGDDRCFLHGFVVPGLGSGGSSPRRTLTARSAWAARTRTWSVVNPDRLVNGICAWASRPATSARNPTCSHGNGPAKVTRRQPTSTC